MGRPTYRFASGDAGYQTETESRGYHYEPSPIRKYESSPVRSQSQFVHPEHRPARLNDSRTSQNLRRVKKPSKSGKMTSDKVMPGANYTHPRYLFSTYDRPYVPGEMDLYPDINPSDRKQREPKAFNCETTEWADYLKHFLTVAK